jgi:hypothetical protein
MDGCVLARPSGPPDEGVPALDERHQEALKSELGRPLCGEGIVLREREAILRRDRGPHRDRGEAHQGHGELVAGGDRGATDAIPGLMERIEGLLR